MNEVIDAFHKLIPSKHKNKGNSITFDCPACGDRRGRGWFFITPSGGFLYHCYNGGCLFEDTTGWEPAYGFVGRARKLFEIMGGNIRDLSYETLTGIKEKRLIFNLNNKEERLAWITKLTEEWPAEAHKTRYSKIDDKIAIDFIPIPLPKDSIHLFDNSLDNYIKAKNDLSDMDYIRDILDVRNYVAERCKYSLYRTDIKIFFWSPQFKRHVIIAFYDRYDRDIIGWIARKIDPGRDFAHIKCKNFPTNFMFNQNNRYRYNIVMVVGGIFDSINLDCLCSFGNVITKKQINMLNELKDNGKKIVLIPDLKGLEWKIYLDVAKKNNFLISIPEYPGNGNNKLDYIKDPGESIERNGVLYTLEAIINGITDDYVHAESMLILHSK
jgi:hypothetical protein